MWRKIQQNKTKSSTSGASPTRFSRVSTDLVVGAPEIARNVTVAGTLVSSNSNTINSKVWLQRATSRELSNGQFSRVQSEPWVQTPRVEAGTI